MCKTQDTSYQHQTPKIGELKYFITLLIFYYYEMVKATFTILFLVENRQ